MVQLAVCSAFFYETPEKMVDICSGTLRILHKLWFLLPLLGEPCAGKMLFCEGMVTIQFGIQF